MTIRPAIAVTLALALAALPVAFSARRARAALQDAAASQVTLASTTHQAARVVDLRARKQRVAEQKRPEQDLIGHVGEALAEAGVPSACFGGVSPEADGVVTGADARAEVDYRQQSVRVTLERMSTLR